MGYSYLSPGVKQLAKDEQANLGQADILRTPDQVRFFIARYQPFEQLLINDIQVLTPPYNLEIPGIDKEQLDQAECILTHTDPWTTSYFGIGAEGIKLEARDLEYTDKHLRWSYPALPLKGTGTIFCLAISKRVGIDSQPSQPNTLVFARRYSTPVKLPYLPMPWRDQLSARSSDRTNPTRVYCTEAEFLRLAKNSTLQQSWTEAIAQGFLSLAKEILPD